MFRLLFFVGKVAHVFLVLDELLLSDGEGLFEAIVLLGEGGEVGEEILELADFLRM